MRILARIAARFRSDTRGLSNIEFAVASSSLAFIISAALLAYGLGIRPAEKTKMAAYDDVDPIITGSVKAPKPEPVKATHRGDCPSQPPVVILRR